MIPGTTNVKKFVQLREIRRKVNLGPSSWRRYIAVVERMLRGQDSGPVLRL